MRKAHTYMVKVSRLVALYLLTRIRLYILVHMILSFLSAQRDQVRERGMKSMQSFMERTLVLVSRPKEMPLKVQY